jgi:hypothetical protein
MTEKKRKILGWVGIIITILAIIFVMLFVNSCGVETPRDLKLGATVQVVPDPEILIQWVYDHSARISRADCKIIVAAAMKTKRPLLIIALIQVESEFVPSIVSNKGAMGLTQVMPIWEKHLITKGIIKERRDLFNIGPSIAAGDEIFGLGLKNCKDDVTKALEIYLGGQDGSYVKRIFANLANLYILVEVMR